MFFLPHRLTQYFTVKELWVIIITPNKVRKRSPFKHCIYLLSIVLNEFSGEKMAKNEFCDNSLLVLLWIGFFS